MVVLREEVMIAAASIKHCSQSACLWGINDRTDTKLEKRMCINESLMARLTTHPDDVVVGSCLLCRSSLAWLGLPSDGWQKTAALVIGGEQERGTLM